MTHSAVHFDTTRVERAHKAVALLSAPGTSRILNDLLDCGPLPRRHCSSPYPELSPFQVQGYLTSLRERQLVEVRLVEGESAYVPTEAAAALGDVYDALNRWAKEHLPHTVDLPYVGRVHEVITLLNEPYTVPILASLADGPRTPGEIEQLIAPCTHTISAHMAVEGHLPRLATRGLLDHADQALETIALTEPGAALLHPMAAVDNWGAEHANVPIASQRRPLSPTVARAILPAPHDHGRTR